MPLVTDVDATEPRQLRAAAHRLRSAASSMRTTCEVPARRDRRAHRAQRPAVDDTHGYINQPEANARAWRNGWFHTGDCSIATRTGDFFFVDRLKDAIRRRGENISSIEVEAEVSRSPAVREAAAVGVPSRIRRGRSAGRASRRRRRSVDPAALLRFLMPRMPHYMVPRYVRVMDALPKTPTNKVRKVEIRQRALLPIAGTASTAGIEVRRAKL